MNLRRCRPPFNVMGLCACPLPRGVRPESCAKEVRGSPTLRRNGARGSNGTVTARDAAGFEPCAWEKGEETRRLTRT